MVDELIRIYQNKIHELEEKKSEFDTDINTLKELIRSLKREDDG